MVIDAREMDYETLNRTIREAACDCTVENCLGHRFIGSGLDGVSLKLHGITGNALGAYLNGATLETDANAQDAVGDTMNAGTIIIHGSVGDAAGYAMRGGEIYVRGNAGYRAGIHMKAYEKKLPVLVIGGTAGSFLGEYQAGGIIVVLAMNGEKPVGNFPCTGMHGGMMFLRGDCSGIRFPSQVNVRSASEDDMRRIMPYLQRWAESFGVPVSELLAEPFTAVTPDTKNPYKQMYVRN